MKRTIVSHLFKKRKLAATVLACSLVLGAVAGCGNKTATTSEESTSTDSATSIQNEETPTTSTPDGFELRLVTAGAIETFDLNLGTTAETLNVVTLTNEGLYKYDETGKISLGLAEAVDISEDGLTYTFTIRDTKWSNGTPLTAHDFEYSWKRLASPELGAEYAYMLFVGGIKNAYDVCYGGGKLDDLGVKATDDKTLVVELDRPTPYVNDILTFPVLGPLNQEFVESQGDVYGFGPDNVIAIGPYVLTEWEEGTGNAVLKKNENYYNADKIEADSISFTEISDSQQQVLAWESGLVDSISITGDYVAQYENAEGFANSLSARVAYIAPNFHNESLQNQNLRYALALSYDKESIAKNILKNGSIAQNFAIPEVFAPDENGQTFREKANKYYLESDKDLAKEYYEKAKTELGKDSFTFELLYDDTEDLGLIAQFIKQEIETNLEGVTIELKTQPKNARIELMKSDDFDLGITFWGADYQDATTFLDLWTTENAYNYGHWSNSEYDKLLEDVYGEYATDNAARIENMVKAEDVILNDVGIFPIYQVGSSALFNPELSFVKSVKGLYLYQYTTKK